MRQQAFGRDNADVRKRLRAIDLFSGCGGLTEGLKQAGFSVIGAVDNDVLAVKTYRANHKDVVVWHTDIRTLSGQTILRRLGLRRGELDLVAGCPPCQGFSRLRTKNRPGVDDDRNDLVLEFLRLVREVLPKTVMMENVPDLGKDSRMEIVTAELSALGYELRCDVLNTADFAVPQRRRRLVMLGSRVGGPLHFARPARIRRTVRDAIACRFEPSDPLHRYDDARSEHVLDLIRAIPKDGGSRSALPAEDRLECHNNTDGFKDVYGRMSWDDVAPTITGGCINPSKGRFLHPEEDRAITLREAAILQSFPPTYYIGLDRGKYAAAQMIGNALPPEFIRRHAAALARMLRRLTT